MSYFPEMAAEKTGFIQEWFHETMPNQSFHRTCAKSRAIL
jgi:hypothetical protein